MEETSSDPQYNKFTHRAVPIGQLAEYALCQEDAGADKEDVEAAEFESSCSRSGDYL